MRSIANGNETVPTVVVGDTAMVTPRAADVVDAVRRHTPDLLADLDPAVALAKGPWHAGLGFALLITVGWFVLATANPTTSYHLAPALVAASWALGRRRRAGRALPAATALTTALGGAVIAVVTTLLLATRGALAGPILFGIPPLTEAFLSVAIGVLAGAGLSLVGRRQRTS